MTAVNRIELPYNKSPLNQTISFTLMLGPCILFLFFARAVTIWLALWWLSFMQIEDEQGPCHSPWLEPMFRATNSHNHTNPQTPFCSQGQGLPHTYTYKKKQFGGTEACYILWRQSGYERQVLCSLWYLSVQGWTGGDVTPERGLRGWRPGIKLIYACIPGR